MCFLHTNHVPDIVIFVVNFRHRPLFSHWEFEMTIMNNEISPSPLKISTTDLVTKGVDNYGFIYVSITHSGKRIFLSY